MNEEKLMTDLLDMSRTTHRIERERLEAAEGTPRAQALDRIQACEFMLTRLLDAAKLGHDSDDLETIADEGYTLLNEAYLLVSPQ